MLVSYGYCNKLPQAWWLTTKMYSFIPDTRSPKSGIYMPWRGEYEYFEQSTTNSQSLQKDQ